MTLIRPISSSIYLSNYLNKYLYSMNNIDKNRCIRSCRDKDQIKRCKVFIESILPSLHIKAKFYTILSNSARLKIVYLLKEEKRLCVCDISEILDMSIPAISQHLKKLRSENIVYTEREGNTIYNKLDDQFLSLLTSNHSIISSSLIFDYAS